MRGTSINALQCSLCKNVYVSKFSLKTHFEQDHGIQITTTALDFPNECDFKYWKSNLEEKSNSRYVKVVRIKLWKVQKLFMFADVLDVMSQKEVVKDT